MIDDALGIRLIRAGLFEIIEGDARDSKATVGPQIQRP